MGVPSGFPLLQDPRTELGSLRLDSGSFYLLSHLTGHIFPFQVVSKKVDLDSCWLALTGLALWTVNEAKTIRSIVDQ